MYQIFVIKEPIGSVAPRFSNGKTVEYFDIKQGATLSITCGAQSFPVPVYKWVNDSFKNMMFKICIKKKVTAVVPLP